MNYNNYTNIKQVLNKIQIEEMEMLKLGNVLSCDIWEAANITILKLIKKIIILLCFEIYGFTINNKKNSILFVNFDKNRKDYDEMYNNVKKTVKQYSELQISRNKKLKFKLSNIFKSITYYSKFLEIKDRKVRVFLAIKLVEYCEIINYMKMFEFKNYKLVVTFADMHAIDNIIVQLSKLKNIKTATLQHGQYFVSNNQGLGCVNYENFISDYMLVWGKNTINELIKAKINPKRLVLAGNPKYLFLDKKSIFEKETENEKHVFALILDGPTFDNYINTNIKLINIANEIANRNNLKFYIKLHPNDNSENYIECVKNKLNFISYYEKNFTVKQISESVDFSIVYLSSVYLELNILNSVVFRYSYNTKTNCISSNHEFTTVDDLNYKYCKFKNNKKQWYLETSEKINQYVIIDNPENNYRRFFKKYYFEL